MLNIFTHIIAFLFGYFLCAILCANGEDQTPPQAFA